MMKSAVLLLSLAVPAAAQNYPFPGAQSDPPVLCTGCPYLNSWAQANAGLPTFPYDTPLQLHTGRIFDSSSTADVQNGMRTIRGGRIRVATGSNRIYLGLGATIAAYSLDTFFSAKLQEPMVAVNTIPTGKPYSGRNPFEKLLKPDRFFYPESPGSGWTVPPADAQNVLNDFDTDDRGYIYLATAQYGWGIASDPGGTDGSHMPSVKQMTSDGSSILTVLSLRSGANYYALISTTANVTRVYDVTTPATPVLVGERSGTANGIRDWAKYDAGQRVAVRNSDGLVRIYTAANLISGGATIADVAPTVNRLFTGLSFDENGTLWLAEYAPGSLIPPNHLWQLTPGANGYTTTMHHGIYGNSGFAPRMIHAAGGYIAVGGQTQQGGDYSFDLRLLRVVNGVPELVNTNEFFSNYYERAPSGYAEPLHGTAQRVHLVAQGGKTYLFYNTYGLGDVYELGSGSRITSMQPPSGITKGGTQVSIYGTGFTAGSTVTFDGLLATSTFVSPTQIDAIAPEHPTAEVDVIVTPPGASSMTAPKKFTYELTTPLQFVATATSTTSVNMSWSSVAGATFYEVSRRSHGGEWSVVGIPTTNSFANGGLIAETTYVYRVRAGDGIASYSPYSALDLATTMTGESAVILAGAPILAADLAKVRSRVNAVRAAAGLPAAIFTGGGVGAPVLRTDITALRSALDQACSSLGLGGVGYTDKSLFGVGVKALHLNQILDSMR